MTRSKIISKNKNRVDLQNIYSTKINVADISYRVDGIINDLRKPEKSLEYILLNIKELAFRLNNYRLKNWVKNELEGYKNNVPNYRIIQCDVYCNLIKSDDYGDYQYIKNYLLPINSLDKKLKNKLKSIRVDLNVSEIENKLKKNNLFTENITPHYQEINKILESGLRIDTAWKIISISRFEGILSSLRSRLQTFLLELDQKIVKNENYSFTSSSPFKQQNISVQNVKFKVAVSFPGEKRTYVENTVNVLAELIGIKNIFYDNWYKAQLAQPGIDIILQNIYNKQTDLVVVFLCKEYNKKDWCGIEWRAIKDLINRKENNKIMLLTFDYGKIDGLYNSTDGMLDLRKHSEKKVAQIILERLSI